MIPAVSPSPESQSLKWPPLVSSTATAEARPSGKLWLCLHFPLLPLEVVSQNSHEPCAVLEEDHGQYWIKASCCHAYERGVKPGIAADAALALIPRLGMYSRDLSAETKAMESLADHAYHYSSAVSMAEHQNLLVEVHGSLRMFGGVKAIQHLMARDISSLGYEMRMACAPSGLASLWLARGAIQCTIQDRHALRTQLSKLDVSIPDWPKSVQSSLRRMGVRSLGDCLRLPRDGLARRVGPGPLKQLDQALGALPETWSLRHPDKNFRRTLSMPCEATDLEIIMQALREILFELQRWLRRRQAGARSVLLKLHHPMRPPDQLRVGMLQARDDAAGMLELARLRLDTLSFKEPVNMLEVEAAGLEARMPAVCDMLSEAANDSRPGLMGLMERLVSRLGRGAVFSVATTQGSRPEFAWCKVSPRPGNMLARKIEVTPQRRPLWLLQRPAVLKVSGKLPVHDGPLELKSGPERIETGWWDGVDIRRDYYVARSRRGQSLWIFEDIRQGGQWYLHGAFG